MSPTIQVIEPKKLIGISQIMSLVNNKTALLWQTFMPKHHQINKAIDKQLISLQIYDNGYFTAFNPQNKFTKWACKEVADFDIIPNGMETLILPAGKYAVFNYKGLPSNAAPFFNYIFIEWIPNSIYELDNRPHFEILGEKYNNTSPDSEEEVWIPIKEKK
ncbi:MAG: GyrI-like domain-containing protein [Bacteroidia bacterium]|nr:GyrI-like domain-containing protein [Bacteroidia bacterium]